MLVASIACVSTRCSKNVQIGNAEVLNEEMVMTIIVVGIRNPKPMKIIFLKYPISTCHYMIFSKHKKVKDEPKTYYNQMSGTAGARRNTEACYFYKDLVQFRMKLVELD